MELTKTDKQKMKAIIRKGILNRCEEWLKETVELINKDYQEEENAFDRCMEITRRSRNFYKEAMRREDYYSDTLLLSGAGELLRSGYLTLDDFKDVSPEIQDAVRLWARMVD